MFGRHVQCEPSVSVAQAVAMVRAGHEVVTVLPFLRSRRDELAALAQIDRVA